MLGIHTSGVLAGVCKHLANGNLPVIGFFPEEHVSLNGLVPMPWTPDLPTSSLWIPTSHPNPAAGDLTNLVLVLITVGKRWESRFALATRQDQFLP